MPKYQLNSGQAEAAAGFVEFLLSPDEKEMIINGPGGTGKTFLVEHLVKEGFPNFQDLYKITTGKNSPYMEITLSATTNKAAEVLQSALKMDTNTIHNRLGIVVTNNYTTGETSLKKSKKWAVLHNTVLIIDEAYMIDYALHKMIQEGTSNCKIVYVGDSAQLNPVKSTGSPLLNKNVRTYTLTEPMRTDRPDILKANQMLRECVINEAARIDLPEASSHIHWVSRNDADDLIIDLFKKKEAKFLAYTNKKVIACNEFVRKSLGLSNEIHPGDYWINNSALLIPIEGSLYSVSAEELLYIVDAEETVLEIDSYELPIIKCLVKVPRFQANLVIYAAKDPHQRNALLKEFSKLKQWRDYFYIQERIADLRLPYASTVHKAQGSTYDNVIIDLNDLKKCKGNDQIRRLMYVAMSRAKDNIYFIQ